MSWVFDLLFRRDGVPVIETAKAETAEALAKASGLETDLSAARNQFANQSNVLHGLKSQFADVQQSHSQLEAALAKTQSELAASLGTNTQFRADFEADAKHDAAAAAEAARLRQELAASVEANTKLRSDLGIYGQRDTALTADISRLSKELSDSIAANTQIRAELAASAAQNAKFRTEFAADAKHDAAADAEIARLRSELADSVAANIKSRDDLKAALTARDGVANTLTLMEQQRSNATAALANLGGEADGLRSELAAAQAAYAKESAQRAALAAEVEAAAKLKTQLAAVENERDTLQKDLRELHALRIDHAKVKAGHDALALQLKTVSGQHDESQKMIALLHSEIEGNKRSLAAMSDRTSEADLAAQRAAERRNAMTRYGFVSNVQGRDDLTLVEGIGPKVEEVLYAAGVQSFAKLAVTPVDDIRALLDSAGSNFRILNPGTWPRQAALIVKDDWAELRRWQDELIAGVEVPKAGV